MESELLGIGRMASLSGLSISALRFYDAANVLIFPTLAAGNAAYKVLAALGGATAIGPILLGVNKPVAVLPRDANVDTIVSMTAYTVARAT